MFEGRNENSTFLEEYTLFKIDTVSIDSFSLREILNENCFFLNLALLDCINFSHPPITASPLGMFCLLERTPNPHKGGSTVDNHLVRILDIAHRCSPIPFFLLW